MNKTAIEWTDFTFNPVTGCWGPGGTAETPNRCPYCYAAKIAHRMAHVEGSGYGHGVDSPNPTGAFNPTFHPDRLDQPAKVKKPSKIFVCSMADLFGDWVPQDWIEAVLNQTQRADYSHHTYQFLTKNPKRLKDFNPWPSNCWVGTTVTNQADADWKLHWLCEVDALVRFVSHEPLFGQIDTLEMLPHSPDGFPGCINMLTGEWWPAVGDAEAEYRGRVQMNGINFAIIGAQTGPGAVQPKPEWVRGLIDQYRAAGVPMFLKDNLKWPEKIQEWPQRAV